MPRKAPGRVKRNVQKFLYWLGPLKCVLLGAALLFLSFIFQLLTSIGVPYIKEFDFFRFDFDNYQFVELGMWAACVGAAAYEVPTAPQASRPETFSCPPARWGWKSLQYAGITARFFHSHLPEALILHPISCGFTAFALISALVTLKRRRHHWTLPLFSFLSCLFAFATFIIDIVTFVPARGKLQSPDSAQFLGHSVISTELGLAFWLSLVTFCFDVIGNLIILAGYAIWRYQRISYEQRRRSSAYTHDIEIKGGSRMARRGYFANDSDDELGPDTGAYDRDAKTPSNSFLMSSLATPRLAKRGGKRKPVNSTLSMQERSDDASSVTTSTKRSQSSRATIGKSAAAAAGVGAGAGYLASRGRKTSTSTRGSRGSRMQPYRDEESQVSDEDVFDTDLDERSREAEAFEVHDSEEEESSEEEGSEEESSEGSEESSEDDDDEDEEELASEEDSDEDDDDDETDAVTESDAITDDAMSSYADARSDAGRSNVDVSDPMASNGGRSRRKPVAPYRD